MRIPGRLIAASAFILLAVPSLAIPREPDYRERGRQAAYRSGLDAGYRTGLHHGEYDIRAHLKFGYRGRDHFREDRHFGFGFRFRGDYKKGFRDGYRRGYREGYERFAFRRNLRRPYFQR